MPILQFECNDCSAVFEVLRNCGKGGDGAGRCLSCESVNCVRLEETAFSPKKKFCPRDVPCDGSF